MKVRVGLAQVNPTVGDVQGNAARIRKAVHRAAADGCDLVVTPQCALSGFPAGALLERADFLQAVKCELQALAGPLRGAGVLVGFPELSRGKVYNGCALIHDGRVAATYRMTRAEMSSGLLQAETSRFAPGRGTNAFSLGGVRIGVSFGTPAEAAGGGLSVCLAAVPYALDYPRAAPGGDGASCVANLTGGQDGLVFVGASAVRAAGGTAAAACRAFDEDYCAADIDVEPAGTAGLLAIPLERRDRPALHNDTLAAMTQVEETYKALVVGLRDFVRKNGFENVLVGASGGIDSSLTLAVTCDALGPEHVTAVSMPSAITSAETREDAAAIARNLGCRFSEIAIAETVRALQGTIPGTDGHRTARENLQARIRGVILMTLANIHSSIVTATGNRSEIQTGYCTLYGDTVGGYAAIGDIPKTMVYTLAELVNRRGNIIPSTVIARAPSAELTTGQTDQDTLPPYPELDSILKGMLDTCSTPEALAGEGLPPESVRAVAAMIASSAHKRRQLPPVTLVHASSIARFIPGPITNAFRELDLRRWTCAAD